jgi:exopolysaccharide biosynthesis polyprenyl glycosylphosphotransferase
MMASPQPWQNRLESDVERPVSVTAGPGLPPAKDSRARFWAAADFATVVIVTVAVLACQFGKAGNGLSAMTNSHFISAVVFLVCFFPAMLIYTCMRFHLYESRSIASAFSEQHLTVQACLLSGVVLAGVLYLGNIDDAIPHLTIALTVCLIAIALGARRLASRVVRRLRDDRGVELKNVLIIGTGPEAQALRGFLDSRPCLGYSFKGFIAVDSEGGEAKGARCIHSSLPASRADLEFVGTLETVFEEARRQSVDEIILATRSDPEIVRNLLGQARERQIDLRVVPELYGGLGWRTPMDPGHSSAIPLHGAPVPEIALIFKRAFDILFSTAALLILAPVLASIALAIKLDSPGPVFYGSDRVGKKGHIFRCVKFRTMTVAADKSRAEVVRMAKRDGVLSKVNHDSRVTRLGSFLRKYSLDELPQFWNVLKGEMSVVGPRPALAGAGKSHPLTHLRRLAVRPGITGLWQVQGGQDAFLGSYRSPGANYVENWSIGLDFQIILRTIQAMFLGAGSRI